MKPLVIASWIRDIDEENFGHFFVPHGDMALANARTSPVELDAADALLLTGGPDVSENFLQQPVPDVSLIQDAEPERDLWEFAALRWALDKGVPILAVCKGTQVMNVGLGGTLHLDIKGHNLPEQKYHDLQELRFAESTTIQFPVVNSSHHQALDKLGAGLVVEAWHAGDGIIEQVRLEGHPFAFGAQYHPERGHGYQPLFDLFAEHIRRMATRR